MIVSKFLTTGTATKKYRKKWPGLVNTQRNISLQFFRTLRVYIIWHLLKVLSPFWHCVAGDTTSHQLPTRIGTSGEHEKSWCDPHSMAKHDATIDNIFAG